MDCRIENRSHALHAFSFIQIGSVYLCSLTPILKIIYAIKNAITGFLQIQPNQFPGDSQEISRTHFLNSRRFLRDKPLSIKMQVKFVKSINEYVTTSSD